MQSGIQRTCLPLHPITATLTGTLPAGAVSSTTPHNETHSNSQTNRIGGGYLMAIATLNDITNPQDLSAVGGLGLSISAGKDMIDAAAAHQPRPFTRRL